MPTCDRADDGPCTGGYGMFTPDGTDLTLCRRHRNLWRREHGKQVVRTARPRYPDGEAKPFDEAEAHREQRERMYRIQGRTSGGKRLWR